MDEGTIGLILIVTGIFMLLAEASSPGFFIAIPATVLLVLGLIGVVAPDIFFTWVSPVVAVAIGIPATVGTIMLYQRLAPPEVPTTTVGTSLIGRHGTVTKEIVPKEISGKISVDNTSWSATSTHVIPVGTEVVIVESTGVHVKVKELNDRREE